jgi:hypothetical protein
LFALSLTLPQQAATFTKKKKKKEKEQLSPPDLVPLAQE